MDWKSWSLEDWNRTLIEVIFLDKDRLEIPITRIQVSDLVLKACTGDTTCIPGQARKYFVAAFGKNAHEIRQHYIWRKEYATQSNLTDIPRIFAALYLTLLAASADETTYDEGNFRKRFVEIIDPIETSELSFSDLPRLWKCVEQWSVSRAKRLKDCRPLHLPKVSIHEKLIGYSKRLAFPSYSDEVRLLKTLQDTRLNSDAGFALIAAAVAKRLNGFSASFQAEFTVFKKLLNSTQHQEAFQCPFWHAVLATSCEVSYVESLKIGKFRLGIDLSDPRTAELYLQTDDIGCGKIAKYLNFTAAQSYDQFGYLAAPLENETLTPFMLQGIGKKLKDLRRVKLWQNLEAGCLPLYQDQYGNMISGVQHYDGNPICLIVHREIAASISNIAPTLNLNVVELKGNFQTNAWTAIYIRSISDGCLSRIAIELPAEVQNALSLSWRPQRLSVTGGAWFGQSLYLNVASIPMVGMHGAWGGKYQLLDDSKNSLAEGVMEPIGDRFRIPPRDLVGSIGASWVRFTLSFQDGRQVETDERLAENLPLMSPMQINDTGQFLADGHSGLMVGEPANIGAPLTLLTKYSQLDPTTIPKLVNSNQASWAESYYSNLDNMSLAFEQLSEALLLRFQRRATMASADIASHIAPACDATIIRFQDARRLLLAAGWLNRIQKRSSPYGVFASTLRAMSVLLNDGAHVVVRIVGMISRSERAQLQASLSLGETAYRIVGNDNCIGIGAVEVRLNSINRVYELAHKLNLAIVDRCQVGTPLAKPTDCIGHITYTPKIPPDVRELEEWDDQNYCWSPANHALSHTLNGRIFRVSAGHRTIYWVCFGESYATTDSEVWARFLAVTAKRQVVGYVAADGSCKFHADIYRLPQSLVKWWMHFGGGYVEVNQGNLVLGGKVPKGIWEAAVGWTPAALQEPTDLFEKAIERRNLALKLHHRRAATL